MVKFFATIEKFAKKGEKTGWSYIVFPAATARKLSPSKVSFHIRGKLDAHSFSALALLPMGGGNFILPLKADVRKLLGKTQGDKIKVEMELDQRGYVLSADLIRCLKAEPGAYAFFKTLPGSHQNYFSKWIESAKTAQTKTKRIVMAVIAAANKQGYAEMLRATKNQS
jgi:hypothetical protein